MPLVDVTVDTNVLMHACNPNEPRCADSISFVNTLLASVARLAIDAGFSTDPAKNTSLIGAEYLAKLVPGSLPHYAVAHLALNGRVAVYGTSLSPQESRKLNQMVANRRDRTFVKVAANSDDCHLVSHDYADFPQPKRKTIRTTFGVHMIDAAACCPLL